MKKFLWVTVAFLLTMFCTARAADQDSNLVVNGGFEDGLKAWQPTGDVHLETNRPLDGRVSVIIGPGAGSLAQRIETGSGNAFTVSAVIQPQRTNGWVFALRFLDKDGHEVMKVDSLSDMKGTGENPRKFNHYLQPH
ncbi:MAG: hypothetical protein ACREDQ_13025, partial [Limisphaerales bacterium]